MRGELVDIGGGRHIRVLCQGPPSAKPLVVLESGIFAGAASWNAVQDDLAAQGLRSCAYDRAGVGYSDPGPSPRDAKAIEGDLEAWLRAKGETGPFVLAAHSMGGLEIRMFAERHPDQVAGLVMVDTTSASLAVTHRGRMFLKTYTAFGRFVEALSRLRLLKLLAPSVADQANHRGPAHAELIYFFGDREDEKVSADEIEHIYLRAKQTLDAGPLDPDIPVTAIVLKDELGQSSPWAAARTAEARASHYGREIDVVNTEHPRLIDRDHASTVVEAIQSVIAADGLRRRARGG
jgi:pimeloyl-ACP methyl ester carboxylesterase